MANQDNTVLILESGIVRTLDTTNDTIRVGTNWTFNGSGKTLAALGGVTVDFDVTSSISLDADVASNFTVDGAGLTLSTTTSGALTTTSAGLMDVNAGANLDIDVTGTYDMLSTSTFSIDGSGASNVTATAGALTVSTVTSGDLVLSSADNIDADGDAVTIDASTGGVSIDAVTSSNFSTSGGNLTLAAGGAGSDVIISAVDDVDMDATDILMDATGGFSIDGDTTSNVTVTTGDLTVSTVTSGTLALTSAGLMDVDAGANLDIDVTGTYDMLSSSTFSIDGSGASNVSTTSGNLTVSTITSGTLALTSAAAWTASGTTMDMQGSGAVTIDSSGGTIGVGTDANNFNINIGTAGTRTVTLGSATAPVVVAGDLTVSGSTTSVSSENVMVADNHLYLNAGYTADAAQEGGLVVNYDPTTTVDVSGGGITSTTVITTTGSTVFAAGDFIQISGAANVDNNGLFEVLSHVGTTLTIDSTPAQAFSQTALVADAGDLTAAITKIALSVLRVVEGSGDWEICKGSNTSSFVCDTVSTSTTATLHQAYKNDADGGDAIITTDATDGAVKIAGTEKLWVTATSGLDVDTKADFDVTQFDVDVTGAGFSLDSNTASNVTTTAAVLTLSTVTSGNLVLSSADNIDADGDAVTIDASTGGVSVDAVTASNFSTSGGDLTLAAGGAGSDLLASAADELDLTSGGLMDVNAGANLDIDVTGTYDMLSTSTFSIDGSGASNVTATAGALTVSTVTSGDLILSSADNIDADGDAVTIDASTGGVSVDAVTASNFSTSGGDLTLAAGGTGSDLLASAADELDLTSGGLMDVNAGANLDIDVTGTYDMLSTSTFSIDGSGASNVTATAGALTVSTVTSGDLILSSADNIDADGDAVTIDASTGGVSIDAVTASNFSTSGGDLTLAAGGAGSDLLASAADELDLTSGGLMDVNAGANLDIDVTGTYDMLSTSTFSIDGSGASNITATAGALTVSTVTSGDLILSSADNIDADGDAVTIDASTGGVSVDAVTASNFSTSGGDLTLAAGGAGSDLLASAADELDLTSGGLMDVNAGANLDIDVTGTYDMLSTSTFSIDGTGASNVSATSGNLTVSTITSGTLALTSAAAWTASGTTMDMQGSAAVTIDSSGGTIGVGTDANNFNINIGTAGTRTITLGSATAPVVVAGDLTVSGSTTSVSSENVMVADNHLYLNAGYTADAAQEGGLVVNYDPTTTVDVSGGGITSTTVITTTGSAVFAAGDFIQISGAANVDNNGLFEVLSHVGTTLTIDSTPAQAFSQTALVADAGDLTAAITKIALSVLRVVEGSGDWEICKGSNTSSFVCDTVSTSTTATLHQAYKNDADGGDAIITTDSTDGAVKIAGTEKLWVTATSGLDVDTKADFDVTQFDVDVTGAGFSLDADTASNVTTTAANLTISTATSGSLIMTSAGLMDVNAGANLDIDVTGTYDMLSTSTFSIDGSGASNVTATAGALTVSTVTSGDLILSSADNIDADGDAVTIDASTGGVSIDAVTASNFSTSGGDLTLAAGGAGSDLLASAADELDLTSGGLMDVNAGANLDIDVTGTYDMLSTSTFSIDGSGASNITATAGALTVSTVTSGDLILSSADNIDADGDAVTIDASTGGVSVDAVTASNFSTSGGDLTLAAGGAGSDLLASAADELDLTSGGLMDVNAGANLDIDVTGTYDMLSTSTFSIDGSGASNITATAGALTVSTVTSGDLILSSADNIDADGDAVTIDASTGGVSVDAVTASNFSTSGGDLTLAAGGAGSDLLASAADELDLTSGGLMDVNAGANLDIDVTGTYDMLSTSTFSIDGTGASNVSATSGNLTVSTITSGTLALTSAAAWTASGTTMDMQGSAAVTIDSSGGTIGVGTDANNFNINIGTAGTRTITLGSATAPVVVAGDLTVSGSTTSVSSENVMVADNHLYLNAGYTADAAQEGGLVVNYDPTTTVDVSGGGITSTTVITTTGSAVFAAGDFIQISGAANVDNNGLFEVLSHVGTTLTIDSTPAQAFSQTALVADAGDLTAAITKIALSVLRVVEGSGDWEICKGSNTSSFVCDTVSTSTTATLHQAYKNDADGGDAIITTDSTDGAVKIAGTEKLWVTATSGLDVDTKADFDVTQFDVDVTGAGFSLDADTASNVTTTAANLTISTATSGSLIMTSAGLMDVNAGANLDIDVTGTYDMLSTSTFSIDGSGASNVTATAGALTVSTVTSGDLILSSADNIDADGDAVTIDASTGGVSVDAVTASNFSTSGGNLTLAAGGAGSDLLASAADELDLTSGGLMDINAGANLDIDVTGTYDMLSTSTFSIDGSGASNVTATAGALTVSTVTSGDLILSSADNIDADGDAVTIDASTGGVSVDAVTASNFSTSGGDLTLAAGGTGSDLLASAADELDLTSGGLMDVNAGANLDIDVTGTYDMLSTGAFSIDGSGDPSNVTLTATGAGDDLTISVAGAFDASLVLSSTGTGTDAAQLTTSAGGLQINAFGQLQFGATFKSHEALAVGDVLCIINQTSGPGRVAKADSNVQPVAATGSITAVTGAELIDGQTFTLSDGVTSKVFEFDSVGGVSGGNVPVSFSVVDSAATIAGAIVTAINGVASFYVSASASGALVSLVNDFAGSHGNVTITETVVDGDFVVSGMSGGVDGRSCVVGICMTAAGAAGVDVQVALPSSRVPVTFATAPPYTANGKVVYLSPTLGQGTVTPPSTSGHTVYRVGWLFGADGSDTTPEVVILPQFIAYIS